MFLNWVMSVVYLMSLQGENNLSPAFTSEMCKQRQTGLWQKVDTNFSVWITRNLKKIYNQSCQWGVIFCHVFSFYTAKALLSGPTMSVLFLSWFNSAPWKIFCPLQPRELGEGGQIWQPLDPSFCPPNYLQWSSGQAGFSAFILDIFMWGRLSDQTYNVREKKN